MCVFRKSGEFLGVFFEKVPYFFALHPIFHPVFEESTYFFRHFQKKVIFLYAQKRRKNLTLQKEHSTQTKSYVLIASL